jgi:hypothetical protein
LAAQLAISEFRKIPTQATVQSRKGNNLDDSDLKAWNFSDAKSRSIEA